jgi:hypothetical protein
MSLYRALGFEKRQAKHATWTEMYRAHRRANLILSLLFLAGFALLCWALWGCV